MLKRSKNTHVHQTSFVQLVRMCSDIRDADKRRRKGQNIGRCYHLIIDETNRTTSQDDDLIIIETGSRKQMAGFQVCMDLAC